VAGISRTARPRLRRDALIVATGDGVRILSNSGAESLVGTTIKQWISRLTPYLDGRTTLGELTRALPADKREMVERIVEVLFERGLVRDGVLVADGRHDGELSHLDSFLPSAAGAFEQYRTATIAVVGDGPIRDELLGVLADSGAGVVTAPAAFEQRPMADLVVHVCERATPETAVEVDRACQAAGVPVVHGVRVGNELWVTSGSWESVWHRLRGWSGGTGSGGTGSSGDGEPPAAAAPAVAAAVIGMAVFRRLTGVADAAGSRSGCSSCTCRSTTSATTGSARWPAGCASTAAADGRPPRAVAPSFPSWCAGRRT
jgi:hypothetical protein